MFTLHLHSAGRKDRVVKAFSVGLALCLWMFMWSVEAPEINAQTPGTGALAGTVTDPSGATVQGAQIEVMNGATGETRTVRSGSNGTYIVPLLPPGTYRVAASKEGFKTSDYEHVQISVTETAGLSIRLDVGSVKETVTVEAAAEQLQTENSSLGRVTRGEVVNTLPLVTRNYTQIIGLNPGIAASVTNAGDLGRGNGGANLGGSPFLAHGGTVTDNNFQMDGAEINDLESSGNTSGGVAIPNPDSIAEFRVQTGQYDASYGRNAGANVNVVTKGGTNQYHGNLWEYFRNDALNANLYFFNRIGKARPVLKQNQYGFAFGGPVVKNKVTFFTSYQGTHQRNGISTQCQTTFNSPPLTDDRSAAALGALFAGQTGAAGGVAIAADGSNIAPQALALLQLKRSNGLFVIPTPQSIDSSQPFASQGFSAFSDACKFDENQFITNLDYTYSDKSKFSGRFFFANSATNTTNPSTNIGGPPAPGFPLEGPQDFRNFSLTHTYIFSPHVVNQATLGFHRTFAGPMQHEIFKYSDIGATVPSFEDDRIGIKIAGTATLGGNGQSSLFAQNTYNFEDSLSYTSGRHNFRFGGGLQRQQLNKGVSTRPMSVSFASFPDFLLGLPGGPEVDGGNGTAVSNIQQVQDEYALNGRSWRVWEWNGYTQDDFKVTPRLTLNLGLRFEHLGSFADALGRNSFLDIRKIDPNPPSTGSLAGIVVASNYPFVFPPADPPNPPGVTKSDNEFAVNGDGQNTWNPRVGFAWQLPYTDRFVLRGGYGVYHSQVFGQIFLQLAGFQPWGVSRILTGANNAPSSWATPISLTLPTLPAFTPYSPDTLQSAFTLDATYRPPTWHRYSLGLQSQLTSSMVLDLTFVGSRGLHMFQQRNANSASLASPSQPIRGETTNTVANVQERVPFVGWGSDAIRNLETAATSWYNGLDASLSKRFSHGLQFLASYTWAKDLTTIGMATTGGLGGLTFGNTNDPKSRYGPEYFVRPQRFVISYIYDLPKPKNMESLVGKVLGGWQVAGVTTYQSGRPLVFTEFNENNITGFGFVDIPQLGQGCSPNQGSLVTHGAIQNKLNNYFVTNCFVPQRVIGDPEAPLFPGACGAAATCPQATDFGNVKVGSARGPGQGNWDISIIKKIPFNWPTEGSNVEFRAELFNAFNHPQFSDPDTEVTDSTFGFIGNTNVNPRVVQFALRLNF